MKPHRRGIPAIAYPILLAVGVAGIVATRRHEDPAALKLPEDLTGTMQKEVTAANDPELQRFYSAFRYAPVWKDRRPELVGALMGAGERGLNPADYLKSQTEVALSKALLKYAGDLRYGRTNSSLYDASPRTPLGELALGVVRDPGGIAAGLSKLDPPFAEFRGLAAALPKATPEERTRIEQAMEQWRWLPRAIPDGAIIVNVPEFRLRAYDESHNVALEMKTIVGLVKQQTPLFAADLKYVVFGPYWNVPRSILENEIVRDIEKDRSYLARNDYEVVDGQGKVVSAEEVSDETLAGLKSGNLRVRQIPGKKNALGRVKFLFPNNNDVYLHDTPSRNLFAREQRTLSHGCVRVENPQALAEWVLRNEPEWDKARIEESLQLTKPLQVNLKNTIPVFMVYHTATVGADGAVHFWKDVYKRETTTAELAPRPRE